MSTQAIGIDFGTTKTLVAYLNPRENRPETLRLGRGSDFVPTTAAIDARGQLFFGDEAEDMLEDPSVAYLRGFKMELGSGTPLYMLTQADGSVRHLLAQELVTAFLRRLRLEVQEKVFMGGEVREAVITRPVQFSPARCQALKEAALAAGFSKVILTTEPEAAGLAFCRLNTAEAFKGNALVIDWGGGTLDIALVSRQGDRIVRHGELTDGDMDIGGERFDERLWKHAEAQLGGARLNPVTQMPRVRKAKEQLSARRSVTLRLSAEGGTCPPITLTRELFESLIAADVDNAASMVQALLARIPAEMKPEMLLLVGGSSAIPLIREKLEAATGLPARHWQYSREAVALGAALISSSGNATPSPSDAKPAAPSAPQPSSAEKSNEKGKEQTAAHGSTTQAAVNAKDKDGQTPLHRAASGGNTKKIRQLLEAGADVNAKDKAGETPLHRAAWHGHTGAVRLLLEAKADVNATENKGKTPLHWAACMSHSDAVRTLLGADASVNARDSDGCTPLHRAAWNENLDVLHLLLNAGANIDAEDNDGRTLLHKAIQYSNTNTTSLLLATGADVNVKDKDGWTPLHLAAWDGHTDTINMLLKAKADVNATENKGKTPLHWAARNGHTAAIRLLLKAGAEVNGGSMMEQTPLDLAHENGNGVCVSVLREFGGKHSLSTVMVDLMFWICVSGLILIGAMIGVLI